MLEEADQRGVIVVVLGAFAVHGVAFHAGMVRGADEAAFVEELGLREEGVRGVEGRWAVEVVVGCGRGRGRGIVVGYCGCFEWHVRDDVRAVGGGEDVGPEIVAVVAGYGDDDGCQTGEEEEGLKRGVWHSVGMRLYDAVLIANCEYWDRA